MFSKSQNSKIPKFLIFSSSYGNVGKSTIISTLSIFLNSRKSKVVIIDFNYVQSHKLPNLLSSPNTEIYGDLSVILEASKTKYKKPYFISNTDKITIFPSYNNHKITEICLDKTISSLFLELKSYYDYIILNLPSYYNSIELMLNLFQILNKIFSINPLGIYVSSSEIRNILEIDRLLRKNTQFYYTAHERILFIINSITSPKKEFLEENTTITHSLVKELFQLPAICGISYISELENKSINAETILNLIHNEKSLLKQNTANLYRTLIDFYESLEWSYQHINENKNEFQPITEPIFLENLKSKLCEINAVLSTFFSISKSNLSFSAYQLNKKIKFIFQIPTLPVTTRRILNVRYKENLIIINNVTSSFLFSFPKSPLQKIFEYNSTIKLPIIKVFPIYKFSDNFVIKNLNICYNQFYHYQPTENQNKNTLFTFINKTIKLPGLINIIEFYNNKSWQLNFDKILQNKSSYFLKILSFNIIDKFTLSSKQSIKSNNEFTFSNQIIIVNRLTLKLSIIREYQYIIPNNKTKSINYPIQKNLRFYLDTSNLSLNNKYKQHIKIIDRLFSFTSIINNERIIKKSHLEYLKKSFYYSNIKEFLVLQNFIFTIIDNSKKILKLPRGFIYITKSIFQINFSKIIQNLLHSNCFIIKKFLSFKHQFQNKATVEFYIKPYMISLQLASNNNQINKNYNNMLSQTTIFTVIKDDFDFNHLHNFQVSLIYLGSQLLKTNYSIYKTKSKEKFSIINLHFEPNIPNFISIKSYLLSQKFGTFKPIGDVKVKLNLKHNLNKEFLKNIIAEKPYKCSFDFCPNKVASSNLIISFNVIRNTYDFCGFIAAFNKLKQYRYSKPSSKKFQIFQTAKKNYPVKDYLLITKNTHKYYTLDKSFSKFILCLSKLKLETNRQTRFKIKLINFHIKPKFSIISYQNKSELYYYRPLHIILPKFLIIYNASRKLVIKKILNLSIINPYKKDLVFEYENTENFIISFAKYLKHFKEYLKIRDYYIPICWYHTFFTKFIEIVINPKVYKLFTHDISIFQDIFSYKYYSKFSSKLTSGINNFSYKWHIIKKFIYRTKAMNVDFSYDNFEKFKKYKLSTNIIIERYTTHNTNRNSHHYKLISNISYIKKRDKLSNIYNLENKIPPRNYIMLFKFIYHPQHIKIKIPPILEIFYKSAIYNFKCQAKMPFEINLKNLSKVKRSISNIIKFKLNISKDYRIRTYFIKPKLDLFKPLIFKINTNLLSEVYKIIKYSLLHNI